jgi:hypothetical protein
MSTTIPQQSHLFLKSTFGVEPHEEQQVALLLFSFIVCGWGEDIVVIFYKE